VTSVSCVLGPMSQGGITGDFGMCDLLAANSALYTIFVVPRTGIIDRIGFWASDVVGSPTYETGLVQMMSDHTGRPSASAYGTSQLEVFEPVEGWNVVQMETPAYASAGDVVAAMIGVSSGVDASNYIRVRTFYEMYGPPAMPRGLYVATDGELTTYQNLGNLNIGALYDDDTVALPLMSSESAHELSGKTTVPFVNDSSCWGVGGRFTVPVSCTCYGIVAMLNSGNGFPVMEASIFGDGVSESCQVLSGQYYDRWNYNGGDPEYLPGTMMPTEFTWEPASLSAGKEYEVLIAAAEENDEPCEIAIAIVNGSASKAYWPDGDRWTFIQYENGTTWVEVENCLPMIGLLVSDISGSSYRSYGFCS
jgi:hypothetical protein